MKQPQPQLGNSRADEFDQAGAATNAPRHLRSDNGPELVSGAVLRWLTRGGIDTAHINPGQPWQNGMDERFNGKLRDECLNMEWFRTRREAVGIIEAWRLNPEGLLSPNPWSEETRRVRVPPREYERAFHEAQAAQGRAA